VVTPERGLFAFCDHLDIRVRDLERAKPFYAALCGALGLTRMVDNGDWICYETDDTRDVFVAIERDPDFTPSRTRIAFRGASPSDVDRISEAARTAGAVEFEAAHACPEYTEGYYASFFCDPDGNRLEVCYRPR